MNSQLSISLTILLSSLGAAQVMVQNPQHLEIPEQRVQMLHTEVCRVVAEEFHTRREKAEGPLILILGDGIERSEADELHRVYTLYLNRWDQRTFVVSDLRLAIHRLTRDRLDQMEREVIRRVNLVAPVNVNSLRGSYRAGPPSCSGSWNNCLPAIGESVGHVPATNTNEHVRK